MNSIELLDHARVLQTRKIKNETAISMEELNGKYKVPYEKLCSETMQAKKEYRAACTRNIRLVADFALMLSETEKSDVGYDQIRNGAIETYEKSGEDPMVLKMVVALQDLVK